MLSVEAALRIERYDSNGSRSRVWKVKQGEVTLVTDRNAPSPMLVVPTRPKATRIPVRPRRCRVFVSQLAKFSRASVRFEAPNHMQIMFSNPTEPEELRQLMIALYKASKGLRPSPSIGPSAKRRSSEFVPGSGNADKENQAPGGSRSASGSKSSKGRASGAPRVKLSGDQQRVINAVDSGNSVFFTGPAGTGKSLLLRTLLSRLPKSTTYATATTGIAAVHISGTTLNTFAGIGDGSGSVHDVCRRVARSKDAVKRWRRCRQLVIDEISMLTGDLFTKLEAVARFIRQIPEPFGGIQLILSGDFLQLPPVVRGVDEATLCFESPVWSKCIKSVVLLREVFRQSNNDFVRMLNKLRLGITDANIVDTLNATVDKPLPSDGIVATTLVARRRDVDALNSRRLDELKSRLHAFAAVDTGSSPRELALLQRSCPAKDTVTLKRGAQVILTKNLDLSKRLTNGSRGVVRKFAKNSGYPIVKFASGVEITVYPQTWKTVSNGLTVASRRQLPLDLAWAISVHKSQGMSLDRVRISLASVFEFGQAYVALSRVRSLEGLWLAEDFDYTCVKANPKVVKFYGLLERARAQDAEAPPSEEDRGASHGL